MVLATTLSSPPRRHILIWLIPLLWNCGLGLWGLSRHHSVWRDEAATWQVSERSTPEIFHMLKHVDVVHGLYYLLMHALFTWFGPSTTTLRLPSVLAMAVAASCVAAIGHRLVGPTVGLTAGLAFALLPAVQFYLQEGRPYALVAAGAGISTLLLVSTLETPGGAVHWAGYSCAVLICGLLNWFSLMLLLAHAATLAWSQARSRTWMCWAAASVIAVAGVLPLAAYSRGQSAQVSWIPPLTWHILIGPAVLLLIGGAGALVDRSLRGRPRNGPFRTSRVSVAAVGLPLLAAPQLSLIGLSLYQPLFLDRYILFSQLGLALLIGTAIGSTIRAVRPRLPRVSRWALPTVIALTMVALLPQLTFDRSPKSRVDDVLTVASDVQRLKEKGNAVLFIPSARRDTRLVSPRAFTGLRDIALTEEPISSGTLNGIEAEPSKIRTEILAQQRILLITDATGVAKPAKSPQDRMKMVLLRKYFVPVDDEQVRGRRVTAYQRRPIAR